MDEKLREDFANNLRKYMEEQDKTQADLARYMDVSTATTADWYNGKKIPRVDKLNRIAYWLGIEISVLLGIEQPKDDAATLAKQMVADPDMLALWNLKQESEERFRAYTKAMLALYGKGL